MAMSSNNIVSVRLAVGLMAIICAIGMGAFMPLTQTHASGMSSGVHSGSASLHYPQIVHAFYAQKPMGQFWIRGIGGYQPRAQALVEMLRTSWTHGLSPKTYHIDRLEAALTNPDGFDRLETEMLMTDAAIRYIRDLTGMRAQALLPGHQEEFWRQPLDPAIIMTQIMGASDPIETMRGFQPQGKLYNALKHELVRLSALPDVEHPTITIKNKLKPGQSAPVVAKLRERLGFPASDSFVYDDALVTRVMELQRSHGMEPDGVITPRVATFLNTTNDDRMKQVIANMERLRWLDQSRPDRYILVNIPSATLWAVEGGAVVLEMPVIVGKKARPTYSFKTEITGVRLNPNWTVPPTIKKKDFLPMLQENPHALSERGIELIHDGQTIDPAQIDWSGISSRELHAIKMVQAPGDENPLGKVRVIMENPYGIYLHDTNNRSHFEDEDRLLSSGCIRVSKPEELAAFILDGTQDWSLERVNASIDSGRMRDVKTDSPVAVYITYQTIWFDSFGQLVYGEDVYGQDDKLAGYLLKSGAAYIPENLKRSEISL